MLIERPQFGTPPAGLGTLFLRLEQFFSSLVEGLRGVDPPGTFTICAGTVPDGWLECDGGEYSKELYPSLSKALGGAFGSPASGNFCVPDVSDLPTLSPPLIWIIKV